MQLFLLAHQDDEFFVMARIIEAARRGDDICVIYLTDGGEQSARRDRESRKVLERVGVAPHRIRFLGSAQGLPDGRLYSALGRAFAALGRELDGLPAPTAVYTHAWEGGHPDHDCVHALTVITALVRAWPATVYQMPFYREIRRLGNYFAPSSPLAENGPVERRDRPWADVLHTLLLMFHYRSQWRTFRWHGPAMLLRRFVRRSDSLQAVSVDRLSERPHQGRLYYERIFGVTWETVSAAVALLAADAGLKSAPFDTASSKTLR